MGITSKGIKQYENLKICVSDWWWYILIILDKKYLNIKKTKCKEIR